MPKQAWFEHVSKLLNNPYHYLTLPDFAMLKQAWLEHVS
jgi:hypothetical protein